MKYLKETLKNGMTVIIIPMNDTGEISCGFFVDVGLKNENEKIHGISHYLEHMIFRGTKNRRSEILAKELNALGHLYNAATNARFTYYYFNGDSYNIKKTLDILIDIYANPAFRKKDIEIEKKVIFEEMRLANDKPEFKLYKSMIKKFLRGSILSLEIIGTEESIDNITKEDFVTYRKQHYRPDNTVFVIAGDIAPIPILKLLEKYLSNIPNPVNPPSYSEDELKLIVHNNILQQEKPFISVTKNSTLNQTYVLLCFPLIDLVFDYGLELEMIMHILVSDFNSRLMKALRIKNGITYGMSMTMEKFYDAGVLMLNMALHPNELINGINIVFRELEKIKKELITPEEKKNAVNALDTDDFPKNPHSVMIYFGEGFLENRNFVPEYIDNRNYLNRITREKLKNICNQIFLKSKTNLFLYGNVDDTIIDKIKWME